MLEQISNALPFMCFFTESKLGKTGLTVTVDLWRWNGSSWTEIVTGGSATEIGDGAYYYNLGSGSVTVEGAYLAVFKTATTSVDQQHIPALWVVNKAGVEYLDGAISSVLTAISSIAAAVWSYATRTLTQAAASVVAAVSGTTVTTYRDSKWSVTLTGLGSLVGWTKLYVTLRTDPDAADSTSLVQLQVSSPAGGTDGLLYINGAAATDRTKGSIVVNDAVTGSITITLDASEAANVTHQKTKYDVKKITATSVDFVSTGGTWQIKASPTRARS